MKKVYFFFKNGSTPLDFFSVDFSDVFPYYVNMQIYSELLITALLFLCNIRTFFAKESKPDSLAILAPLSLLLSTINLFAFGFSILNIYLVLLAVLVLLSNFHALLRYSARLYVDHYSPLMTIWAVLTSLLCIPAFYCAIFFHPVEKPSSFFQIEETLMIYNGTFANGFTQAQNFKKGDVFITKYMPAKDITGEKETLIPLIESPVILFVPDKRADTVHYKPYLQLLAQKGYRVYSADFYTNDGRWLRNIFDSKIIRRFAMVFDSLSRTHLFNAQLEYYSFCSKKEINALLSLIDEDLGSENTKIFLITDWMGKIAASDLINEKPDRFQGTLNLEDIDEYTTKGYGLISLTDPLLAKYMKISEDGWETARAMADATKGAIE